MRKIISRGDLYYADLDTQVVGSEESGIRPVVILQNDTGNKYSPTVIVAPITSKIVEKSKLPTHVILDDLADRLSKASMVLVEQVRVIDKRRLKNYIGFLNILELEALDQALMIALGIDNENELEGKEAEEYINKKQIASYAIIAFNNFINSGNTSYFDITTIEMFINAVLELHSKETVEEYAKKLVENTKDKMSMKITKIKEPKESNI